ncbi:MAG: gliding motility lipoprotein GldH [Crocinitomicaceae bacterium]|nr:gliding motility lipoprotein GldH [Crocinitomicaceae bacterium]
MTHQKRTINKWLRYSFAILALSFGLISCSEKPFYEKVYSFKGNEWDLSQKPTFKVTIDDTTATYRFVLSLRTTSSYQYNNIWLFWHSQTPTKEKVREPFEIKIQNSDGTWIGKNSGTIIENQLTFADRKITVPGQYIFTIEQAVTVENLDNVLDLGLSIYKANSNQKE